MVKTSLNMRRNLENLPALHINIQYKIYFFFIGSPPEGIRFDRSWRNG